MQSFDDADQYIKFGVLMGETPERVRTQLSANEQIDVVEAMQTTDISRYNDLLAPSEDKLYSEFSSLLGGPPSAVAPTAAASASNPLPAVKRSAALTKAQANALPAADFNTKSANTKDQHPDFRRNVQELLTKNRRRVERGSGRYTDETEVRRGAQILAVFFVLAP